jgi:TM2 domain-containing membrane protein YozV
MNNMMMKQGMTSEQLAMVQGEMNKKQKSKGIAYALWFFLMVIGGHRFYTRNTGYAIMMILFGWATLFIWNFLDVFFIGKRIEQLNNEMETELILQAKAFSNTAV